MKLILQLLLFSAPLFLNTNLIHGLAFTRTASIEARNVVSIHNNNNKNYAFHSLSSKTIPTSKTTLYMGSSLDRSRSTKKGVQTITEDKVKTKMKEDIKDETEWRVVLHNDEVHTFEYVVMSIVKVIGTIDRKRAFDICVVTHGTGKATLTTSWKQQAEKYCLGLQRQGLTASISPDSGFKGGKGGDDDADGGGGGGSDGPGTA